MGSLQISIQQQTHVASEGYARSHTIVIDRPIEKEGTDTGPRALEYFLLGYGGCFMSNMLELVRNREADISNIRLEVTGTTEGTPKKFTHIHSVITADYADRAQMEKFVVMAERGCTMVNTLKDVVQLSFEIV